jgi:L-amino acid N-acyltransferase YncA
VNLAAWPASPADAQAIATIYNEGIADRIGTFETEPRSAEQIATWFDGRHPIIVVEEGPEIVAFASTSAYRARPCYAGIAEFWVYVARKRRGACRDDGTP